MEYNVNDYEVIYMIRENDADYESFMYDKYRPLVRKIAKKYYLLVEGKITFEDMVQEGMIGLSNAVKKFDENGDAMFYTYLNICVERHLLTYCRNVNSKRQTVLNNCYFDEGIDKRIDNSVDHLELMIVNEQFTLIKNSLDFLDSNIFELKYNGFTYTEISQLLDISYGYLMHRMRKIKDILKRKKNFFI